MFGTIGDSMKWDDNNNIIKAQGKFHMNIVSIHNITIANDITDKVWLVLRESLREIRASLEIGHRT